LLIFKLRPAGRQSVLRFIFTLKRTRAETYKWLTTAPPHRHPQAPIATPTAPWAAVHPSSSFLTVEGCVENKNGRAKGKNSLRESRTTKKLHSLSRRNPSHHPLPPPSEHPTTALFFVLLLLLLLGRPSFIISDWHPVFMFA